MGAMGRHGAAITALAALLTLVPAQRVAACSCPRVPVELMHRIGLPAFVGTLVDRRSPTRDEVRGPYPGPNVLAWTFDVERAAFGSLPRRLVVLSDRGDSCGIEAQPGQRVAMFLVRREGHWRSGHCWRVDPDELIAAARHTGGLGTVIGSPGWIAQAAAGVGALALILGLARRRMLALP